MKATNKKKCWGTVAGQPWHQESAPGNLLSNLASGQSQIVPSCELSAGTCNPGSLWDARSADAQTFGSIPAQLHAV